MLMRWSHTLPHASLASPHIASCLASTVSSSIVCHPTLRPVAPCLACRLTPLASSRRLAPRPVAARIAPSYLASPAPSHPFDPPPCPRHPTPRPVASCRAASPHASPRRPTRRPPRPSCPTPRLPRPVARRLAPRLAHLAHLSHLTACPCRPTPRPVASPHASSTSPRRFPPQPPSPHTSPSSTLPRCITPRIRRTHASPALPASPR